MEAVKSPSILRLDHDNFLDLVSKEYQDNCRAISKEAQAKMEAEKNNPEQLREILNWENQKLEEALTVFKENLSKAKKTFFLAMESYVKSLEDENLKDIEAELDEAL